MKLGFCLLTDQFFLLYLGIKLECMTFCFEDFRSSSISMKLGDLLAAGSSIGTSTSFFLFFFLSFLSARY